MDIAITPARRRAQLRKKGIRGLNCVIGVAIIAVMLFPAYWMANLSLQNAGNAIDIDFFPIHPDLSAYARALSQQSGNLLTSLTIAVGTVILTIIVAAPAAHVLAHLRFRWVKAALLIILITQMVPSIVIAQAVYVAYAQIGLLNTILGLILADTCLAVPFAILLLHTFMLGIPESLIEAARVDGAGPVRTFFSIVLPLSRNGVITSALFAFLFAWGDFFFALTLSSTPDVRPITLGIYLYLGAYGVDWASIMATGVIASIPAVILLLFAQKYVATGTLGGSVKS